jgi:hypothetical protein
MRKHKEEKKKTLLLSPPPPHCILSESEREIDNSLNTKRRIGDRCIVTIDKAASEIIATPEITGGQPDRKLTRLYVLQMATWETLPVFMEVL